MTRDDSSWRHQPPGVPSGQRGSRLGPPTFFCFGLINVVAKPSSLHLGEQFLLRQRPARVGPSFPMEWSTDSSLHPNIARFASLFSSQDPYKSKRRFLAFCKESENADSIFSYLLGRDRIPSNFILDEFSILKI